MATALNTWKPRFLSYFDVKKRERMAAGVVQHTKRTTMEMRTITSILSSAFCRDRGFRREVRLAGRWAGVTSGVQEDGSGDGVRHGLAAAGTVSLGPLEVLGAELDCVVLLVFLEGCGEECVEDMCCEISGLET